MGLWTKPKIQRLTNEWFPNTSIGGYWSSSIDVNSSLRALSVYFNDGDSGDYERNLSLGVRLVRSSK